MTRASAMTVAAAIVITAACSAQELPHTRAEARSSAAIPEREFLSEAQAARARHYWHAETLEAYRAGPAPDGDAAGT